MLDAVLVLGCNGLGRGWCSVLLVHWNRAGRVEQGATCSMYCYFVRDGNIGPRGLRILD